MDALINWLQQIGTYLTRPSRHDAIQQAKFKPGKHEMPMCQREGCFIRTWFRFPTVAGVAYHSWNCYLDAKG